MFTTFTIRNSEECSNTKFEYNRAYSRAWGSLTIGIGWTSTLFSSIGSLFKSKPKWTSLPDAKSTNSVILYFASTISSLANYIYFSTRIFSLPRFQDENLMFLTFLISHVHHPWQNWHSSLHVKSWTSSNYFVWFGICLSPHLRALHNSMP